MVIYRALCIHDLVFVQDELQTRRNCTTLGITTALMHPAKPEWELHSRRRWVEEFSVPILNV